MYNLELPTREKRIVYANTGSMECFECGDIGHKRMACPHKAQDRQEEVAEAEQRVVGEDVQRDKEDVHILMRQMMRECQLRLQWKGTMLMLF